MYACSDSHLLWLAVGLVPRLAYVRRSFLSPIRAPLPGSWPAYIDPKEASDHSSGQARCHAGQFRVARLLPYGDDDKGKQDQHKCDCGEDNQGQRGKHQLSTSYEIGLLDEVEYASVNAECAEVSEPGYYVAGQQVDVQDVYAKSKPSVFDIFCVRGIQSDSKCCRLPSWYDCALTVFPPHGEIPT